MEDISKTVQYYIESIFNLHYIKVIFSFIFWIFVFLIWWVSTWLVAVFSIYAIDTLLWVFTAIIQWKYEKSRGVQGVVKFILYCVAMITGNLFDVIVADFSMIEIDIKVFLFKYWIVMYIWVHEWLSLLNKLKVLWVPLPSWVFEKIQEIKKKLE